MCFEFNPYMLGNDTFDYLVASFLIMSLEFLFSSIKGFIILLGLFSSWKCMHVFLCEQVCLAQRVTCLLGEFSIGLEFAK